MRDKSLQQLFPCLFHCSCMKFHLVASILPISNSSPTSLGFKRQISDREELDVVNFHSFFSQSLGVSKEKGF